MMLEEILEKLSVINKGYYRLLLVVGQTGIGKTELLGRLHKLYECHFLNLNLELASEILKGGLKKQDLDVIRTIKRLIEPTTKDCIIIDNTEILFQKLLNCNPINVFKHLSREKTLIVSLNGILDRGYLIHGNPKHSEFLRYNLRELEAEVLFIEK